MADAERISKIKSIEQYLTSPNNANRYPDYIMPTIRNGLGLDAYNTERDDEINSMDKDELFNQLCSLNGFGRYGNTIRQWVEDIYNVSLEQQRSAESNKEDDYEY